jgi:phosphohistidine phosphatase
MIREGQGVLMELYFLRHGKAEDPGQGGAADDFSRALTEKGIDEMEAEAKALDRLGVRPELILTSPLVRAKETAQIVAKRLGLKKELVETELLAPGCNLNRLQKLLVQHGACQRIMLVGHEPDFSTMVGELVGGAVIEMKKGGLALVTIERALRAGSGVLEWLVPPRILIA